MNIEEIFKDLTPNPNRKLYSLNIMNRHCCAEAQDWVEEYCVFPYACDGTQILFVSDASPLWISKEFHSAVGYTLTIMSPSSFFSNNVEMWLYAYFFHKANGYVYSADADKQMEVYLEHYKNLKEEVK